MTTFNFNGSASQCVVALGRLGNKDEDPCKDCSLLKKSLEEIKQLESESNTMLSAMEFVFALADLWVKVEGPNSAIETHVELDKELAGQKEEVRALYNNLIETGDPAFLDCFFDALRLPKDFRNLI